MARFKRTKLNLGEGDVWKNYNYKYLKGLSDTELRAEYSRLRDIAQKRIKRLSESEWTWTNVYQQYKEGFPELSQIRRRSDIVKELVSLGHFVYNKETSISGLNEMRAKSIESLNEFFGDDLINKENFQDWINFIETYKKMADGHSPTAEQILGEYDSATGVVATPEELRKKFQDFTRYFTMGRSADLE